MDAGTRGHADARTDAVAELAALARARYVSLESRRKDGSAARVPVWVVDVGGTPTVWTHGGSHKVRRIRRDARVRVAPCNARGTHILGCWLDCTATVVEAPQAVAAVRRQLRAKYGWQLPLIDALVRWRGQKLDDFVAIELRPAATTFAPAA